MSDELERAAALRPVLLRLNNLIRRRVPSVELTPAQSTALTTVLDHGPLRMGELAGREQIRMPTATSIVRRMESLDLLHRTPDPADGRAVLIALTDTGRALLERVGHERNEILADMLAELTADQRQAIDAAAPALRAMLALDLPGPARQAATPTDAAPDSATATASDAASDAAAHPDESEFAPR